MQGQKTSNNKAIKEWYAEHQYMMIEVLMVTTTAKQSQLPSYIFQLASATSSLCIEPSDKKRRRKEEDENHDHSSDAFCN